MANLVITTSETNIDVDFGIYGDGSTQAFETRYDSNDIVKVERMVDHVIITMNSEKSWYVCYTATSDYMIVDSIDGVAPISNNDLYNKLKELM